MNRKLSKAIKDYEGQTGFDALNWRALPKEAALAQQLEAAKKDLKWYQDHSQEAARLLSNTIWNVEP